MNLNDSNIRQAVIDWTAMDGLYCYDGYPNKTISTKQHKTMKRTRQHALFQYGHISDWNTSAVTCMEGLFRRLYRFDDDISGWDVSNVTDMSDMFHEATSFNQPLNDWDMSNVRDICSMFDEARSFNQPLDKWNVSKVTNMNHVFNNATSFNQPLNDWDMSNVRYMDGMLFNAVDFNQQIDQLDVSNVVTEVSCYAMFGDCYDNFKQHPPKGIDIDVWNSDYDL